jgi:hypothetical protein
VTGQTVFADGGLALHSPIDAYGHTRRVYGQANEQLRPGVVAFLQSLAGNGFASLRINGALPTVSVPRPALVTSTSEPDSST